jgi:hypothetical protein
MQNFNLVLFVIKQVSGKGNWQRRKNESTACENLSDFSSSSAT